MAVTRKEMFPFPIIRKRDGRMNRFDMDKIAGAIHKAFYASGVDEKKKCEELAQEVVDDLFKSVEGNVPHVEDIQDAVERTLISHGYARQAKAFILYRAKRTSIREGKSELMDSVESILRETHKDAPHAFNSPSAKMLKIAAAATRTFYLTRLIPSQFADAHIKGDIHIHDLDYYGKTINSLQIPLKQLLQSGFSSGYGYIRPPRRYSAIGALTAIIIQSCQNDLYGGQAIPEFDTAIGEYARENLSPEERDDESALFQAMEGLVYNLNMLYSRMGAQVPVSTINLGLDTTPEGRRVAGALLKALHKGLGRGETPLFPWVVFQVKDEVNLKKGDPNYDLYQKAIEVAARRMNPVFAFVDSEINREAEAVSYWGDGSRAVPEFSGKYREDSIRSDNRRWGWGNLAQVTMNLTRIAFKVAHKRLRFVKDSFHNEIRRVMDLCARQLVHRRDVLMNLKVSELPFVMSQGIYKGTESLARDDSVEKALDYGVMTMGLVGLTEAMYIIHGRDHAHDEEKLKFALETMEFMNQVAGELSNEFGVNFLLSASSSGYAAERFAQLDRIEYGITPMVNDKKYYHQGFEIPCRDEIPWDKKIEIEGGFHKIIPGGHFTFVESPTPPTPEEYEEILQKMHDSGVALGGISFPLHESLKTGEIVKNPGDHAGQVRTIHRVAGLLLPDILINEGLMQQVEQRSFNL